MITVPEYPVPDAPNVLRNSFSLHRVTEAALADAARTWAPRLADLPRPYIAVLVGGYSGRYALDREKAERLAREASALARQRGGSLLVTTSGRTSRAAAEALERAIDVPCRLFRWAPGAPDNPYYGYLALADAIIVTCESATMLAEACATRKPVYMFDLDRDDDPALARAPEPWQRRLRRAWSRCNLQRLKALLYARVFLRFAPRPITRDITRVHDLLLASGRAVWLGQAFPAAHAGAGGRPGALGAAGSCARPGPGCRAVGQPSEHRTGRRRRRRPVAGASVRDRAVLAAARMNCPRAAGIAAGPVGKPVGARAKTFCT